MPASFLPVIGSFRKMAASTMASSGMLVVMIEASTGEVSPTPKMKLPWLKTMASREAAKSFNMSFGATRSGLKQNETSQKRIMAPPMRSSETTSGVIAPPIMMYLATGDIRPHMTLAPSMELWPLSLAMFMTDVILSAKIEGVSEIKWYFHGKSL